MHDLEVEAVARALGKCSEDELSDWFKVARVAIAAYEGSRSGSVEVDQRLTPEEAKVLLFEAEYHDAADDPTRPISDWDRYVEVLDAGLVKLRALAGSVGEPDA